MRIVYGNNDRCHCNGGNKEAEWMPVRAIVIRRVAVVSVRIIAAMTIVVVIGMVVVDLHVLVDFYVFAVINIDVDVVIPTPDGIARVFNRFISTSAGIPVSTGIPTVFWPNCVA